MSFFPAQNTIFTYETLLQRYVFITEEFLQFTRKRLQAFVRKFVKKAKFMEDNSSEVTFLLPETSAHNGDFEDLFMELERSKKKLGISSFGVSDTSLEEVSLTFLLPMKIPVLEILLAVKFLSDSLLK